MNQNWVRVFIGLFAAMYMSVSAAAPAAKLWARWQTADPQSAVTINHRPLDNFLAKYLVVDADGNHLVDYENVSNEDKKQLNNYVQSLSELAISQYAPEQQFAYWINLYNAHTIELILDNYPVDSILSLSTGFIGVFLIMAPGIEKRSA